MIYPLEVDEEIREGLCGTANDAVNLIIKMWVLLDPGVWDA
ncbi:MAG: hypothetical protein QF510_02635 [Rhodospirillales bacterium]|nr:hypothetical protein [Rhodospirillales bacterium]